MEYIIIILSLFILMLAYFKIANKYNIVDKPNHRSAHTEITLRGGGIIFPIAFLIFLSYEILFNNYPIPFNTEVHPNFWIFGTGLIIICTISFIDDVIDLSTKIRLVFHFIAVTLLLYFINAFQLFPWWIIPIFYVFIIGILNAYNFMDGINGMSGLYSLVVLGSLAYINQYINSFIEKDFIIYPILACLVFLIFNFRKRAKCFMGDIGSMGLAFWVIALIALLMIKTQEFKWILFMAVYGVDTVLTIIERLKLKENIFDAHRRHLYQILSNDKKVPHRIVSFVYVIIQLGINVFVTYSDKPDWLNFFIILVPLVLIYLIVKTRLTRQILISK